MPATPGDLGFSESQVKYARDIAEAGTLHGASKDDIVTALSVALAESSLQNLANSNVPESLNIGHDGVGSDHNSVGLFQQQVGIWGDAGTLMDPVQSSKKFYAALKDAPPGDPWVRAQAVQKSAFPDGRNYKAHYDEAVALYAAVVDPSYKGVPDLNMDPRAGAGPDWAAGLTKLGTTLGDPMFWQRVGLFALGAALVLVAVWKFTGAGQYLESAAKAAVAVAL